jgi:hypothetical protein
MQYPAALASLLLLVGACGKGEPAKVDPAPGKAGEPVAAKPAADAPAIELTIDGTPMTISAADVSTTFREVGTHHEFKILAGAEGKASLVLTAISDMTGPSSTPSGAPAPESGIHQGSVSLQNVPDTGYTTNSFDTASPETSQPVADAVVITKIEADGEARIVTGTFSATTFATRGSKDPKDKDHVVKGTFRVRHASPF